MSRIKALIRRILRLVAALVRRNPTLLQLVKVVLNRFPMARGRLLQLSAPTGPQAAPEHLRPIDLKGLKRADTRTLSPQGKASYRRIVAALEAREKR